MAVRDPKTGRYESAATTRARIAKEKAEAELAAYKEQMAERERQEADEPEGDGYWMAGDPDDEELNITRGEQLCVLLAACIMVVALFAATWWVAGLIRAYMG